MSEVKRWIITGASFGTAVALVLLAVVGSYLWYESRPKPPKPWDSKSITASYDSIGTEGDHNTLVFYYVLQNNTDFDYEIKDASEITLLAKLKHQQSLTGSKNDSMLNADIPLFLPAKQRLRFGIHVSYPYDKKENLNASEEERAEYRKELSAYVRKQIGNVDGFTLFDEAKRYQVEFAAGW